MSELLLHTIEDARTHMHMHICTCTYAHAHTHTHTYTCVHVHVHSLHLQHSPNVSKLLLHTSENSQAKVEGYAALMNSLKNNSSITDLTLAKDPKVCAGTMLECFDYIGALVAGLKGQLCV